VAKLRSRSCIIDGEAVACGDDDGIASLDRIRYRRHDADVFIWAFDLIELNGDDLRRDPLKRAQGRARYCLLYRFTDGYQERCPRSPKRCSDSTSFDVSEFLHSAQKIFDKGPANPDVILATAAITAVAARKEHVLVGGWARRGFETSRILRLVPVSVAFRTPNALGRPGGIAWIVWMGNAQQNR
jgi:hypothetical protein